MPPERPVTDIPDTVAAVAPAQPGRPEPPTRRAWALSDQITRDLWRRPTANVPALDGLRALACASIVFFHCALFTGVFGAPAPGVELTILRLLGNGAWAGVDVFFVLSGFLMGRILLRDLRETGRIAYGRFYVRRVLRIFPAYYLVLSVTLFVIARQNVGNILFYSGARNWAQLRDGSWTNYLYLNNYVGLGAPNVLSWGWSLCVEEHFYLLLPGLLAVTFRARGKRARALLLGSYVALPVLGRAAQYLFDPATVEANTFYYFTHNRLDQLFVGVLVAYVYLTARDQLGHVVSRLGPAVWVAGLLAIATVWVFGGLQHAGPFTVIGQLFVTAAGAALLLVNGLYRNDVMTRFLGHPLWYPLARVSYGTYLIHPFVLFWCLDQFRRHLPLGEIHAWSLALIYTAVLALSLALASTMFLAVERPLLDWGHRLGRRPRVAKTG
jgi:peptidoglycan/LPS O-acetylase OafA/YrhL